MGAEYCEGCNNHRYLLGVERDLAVALRCPQCSAHCPKCDDEGAILQIDPRGYDVLQECRCQALRNRTKRFNAARILRSAAARM